MQSDADPSGNFAINFVDLLVSMLHFLRFSIAMDFSLVVTKRVFKINFSNEIHNHDNSPS